MLLLIFSHLHPFPDYYFIPIIFQFAYEGENQGKLINVWRSENIKRQHLFKCIGNERFTYQKCFLEILTMDRFNFIGRYTFCTFRPIHVLNALLNKTRKTHSFLQNLHLFEYQNRPNRMINKKIPEFCRLIGGQ